MIEDPNEKGIPSPFMVPGPDNQPPPMPPPNEIKKNFDAQHFDGFMQVASAKIKAVLGAKRFVCFFSKELPPPGHVCVPGKCPGHHNDLMTDGYSPDQLLEIGKALIELSHHMRNFPPPPPGAQML